MPETETQPRKSRQSPTELLQILQGQIQTQGMILQRLTQMVSDLHTVAFRVHADTIEELKAEIAEQQAEAEEAQRLAEAEASEEEE